jgi:hypothetical protein
MVARRAGVKALSPNKGIVSSATKRAGHVFSSHMPEIIFCVFCPKIACQALKQRNPLKQKEIELAY